MKPIFVLILALITFSGCNKNSNPAPQKGNGSNSSGGSSQTPPDTTPKITHDDSIHMATFNIKPQAVNMRISGTKLVLVYDENVNILLSREGFGKTSAIHLHEDFSKSGLFGLDYTTVASGGNTTFNWVDDNLNNVILKTETDTVVNNRNMIKINVHRAFTFAKDYFSTQAAQNEQGVFIARKNDTVTFSAWCYYNQKNYLPVSNSAGVVYSK
jgi:hypothetical protein